MSKVTIAYFDGRARVEPIRVMLEELAIPYEDQRVSFANWVKMKSDTPFGALPSYRDGDFEIFQSHAIIRHLARVHGLYGVTEADRVRCDVIEEAVSDLELLSVARNGGVAVRVVWVLVRLGDHSFRVGGRSISEESC